MRRLLIIAGLALLALGMAGAQVWRLDRPPPSAAAADRLAAAALSRLAAEPGAVEIDLEALWPAGAWMELLDPALRLPQSHTLPYADLQALSGCDGAAPAPAGGSKAAIWQRFTCGARAELPEGFFRRRPLMHHSGASYVALALARGGRFAEPGFESAHLGQMHAAELSGHLDPARRVLAALDAPALQALHRGWAAALAPGWMMLREPGPGRRYRAWPAARWRALGAGAAVVAERGAAGCLSRVGELCWRPRDHAPARARWHAAGLAAGSIALCALLAAGWRWRIVRRRERAARGFILRTLTHELRTPVTALTLALEPLRARYDALPPPAQDALLALSAGVARLKRTLAASARYVELGGRDAAARVRPVHIPSINRFVADLLDGQPVELRPLTPDRALRCDPEWLALCLRNLVDNAHRHGRPPVRVTLGLDGAHLLIAVSDGGDTSALDLRAMTRAFRRGDESKGLGLGLSLVVEAVGSLGGALSHRAAPTEFRLRLPGVVP